jgi:hypothetical protein
MKKTILTFAIGITCSLLLAQAKTSRGRFFDSKTLLAMVRFDDPSLYKNNNTAPMNEVNAKAVRDFRKTFKDAVDEKWYEIPNAFLAEYMRNDKKYVVVYNRKGKWQFTISYYDEKNLPDEVKGDVKRVYYDYSISRVEEIRINDKTIYVVHMENETTWKNLRICDGEMEVIEDFNKN